MSYVLKTQIAAKGNYGGARSPANIQWLVYHYTANDGDTAIANGNYFQQHIVQASAHFFVDDATVVQSVPELNIAWSVGGVKWNDCGQTGGGKYYGIVGNTNSLSIEMCDTVRDGIHDFSTETLHNAAELGGKLCVKYGIGLSHVICHFDVNGKHCPDVAGWIGSDRSKWAEFRKELEIMTGQEIVAAMNAYLRTLPCPPQMQPLLADAVRLGITDGSTPCTLVPAWRAAIMARNAVVAAKK